MGLILQSWKLFLRFIFERKEISYQLNLHLLKLQWKFVEKWKTSVWENKIIRSVQVHGFDVFPLCRPATPLGIRRKAFNSKSAPAESPISFDEDKISFDEDDERNHNFLHEAHANMDRAKLLAQHHGLKQIFHIFSDFYQCNLIYAHCWSDWLMLSLNTIALAGGRNLNQTLTHLYIFHVCDDDEIETHSWPCPSDTWWMSAHEEIYRGFHLTSNQGEMSRFTFNHHQN